MKRDYEIELQERVKFIQNIIKTSHVSGIVYGNSGGKDCALVSILCKKAIDNVVGIIMPCESSQNYGSDMEDARKVAEQFNIDNVVIDLTDTKKEILKSISSTCEVNKLASSNIAPRLRMTTLYTYAQANNLLVAGTGNACERYVGYFTKWGDGAHDFNPISDLTVSEIYEFLEYLDAPSSIISKKPSAGLYEGQTDEKEMNVTYSEIEDYINGNEIKKESKDIIERMHNNSLHKLQPISVYKDK